MKPSIRRTKIIKGTTIPSFIHNFSFHFHNLEIYEDEIIECWEYVDLPTFREKIGSGWVTPGAPDGSEISIFHLGDYVITDTQWIYNKTTYYEQVAYTVQKLKAAKEKIYSWDIPGSGKEYFKRDDKLSGPYEEETIRGDQTFFFYKEQDEYYITDVRVYADGSIQLEFLPETKEISFDQLDEYIAREIIVTSPPAGSRIRIHGLGSFILTETKWFHKVEEKRKELDDMVAQLNGKNTTSDACIEVYEQYLKNPTKELKRKLRIAYEKVPEHLRIYLLSGMDTKDFPIRHIIYSRK